MMEFGHWESTYKSCAYPVHDVVGQISMTEMYASVDIGPMNFGQVSEETQQVISVGTISNMFQKTGGIGNSINGNVTNNNVTVDKFIISESGWHKER